MPVLRLATVVTAIVVCAWFVVGIRQAHEIAVVTPIAVQGPSAGPGQLAKARHELDSAAFLNPDRETDILRGRIALSEGHHGQARRIIESVTRTEPLNLEAWIWLAGASLGAPRQAKIASAHIAALDPLDAAG